ncbi:hypothetical protein P4O66_001233 [Electrophorus voltai]|uniref:LIM zinc-binding domain-containing protein n=1 Tax=Electrophorus voltai TaxID=2609070 RepID=A0AAD9DWU6_9TELE|nr:hypothetical protein P4O66_001233 [Electrophorus voltai]
MTRSSIHALHPAKSFLGNGPFPSIMHVQYPEKIPERRPRRGPRLKDMGPEKASSFIEGHPETAVQLQKEAQLDGSRDLQIKGPAKTLEERRSSLDAEIDSLTSILADLESSSPYKTRAPQATGPVSWTRDLLLRQAVRNHHVFPPPAMASLQGVEEENAAPHKSDQYSQTLVSLQQEAAAWLNPPLAHAGSGPGRSGAGSWLFAISAPLSNLVYRKRRQEASAVNAPGAPAASPGAPVTGYKRMVIPTQPPLTATKKSTPKPQASPASSPVAAPVAAPVPRVQQPASQPVPASYTTASTPSQATFNVQVRAAQPGPQQHPTPVQYAPTQPRGPDFAYGPPQPGFSPAHVGGHHEPHYGGGAPAYGGGNAWRAEPSHHTAPPHNQTYQPPALKKTPITDPPASLAPYGVGPAGSHKRRGGLPRHESPCHLDERAEFTGAVPWCPQCQEGSQVPPDPLLLLETSGLCPVRSFGVGEECGVGPLYVNVERPGAGGLRHQGWFCADWCQAGEGPGQPTARPDEELDRLTRKMLYDMNNPPSEEYFGQSPSLGPHTSVEGMGQEWLCVRAAFPPGRCSSCGENVVGEGTGCTAMDQVFHVDCFICMACSCKLRGKPFYAVDKKAYCEPCYIFSYHILPASPLLTQTDPSVQGLGVVFAVARALPSRRNSRRNCSGFAAARIVLLLNSKVHTAERPGPRRTNVKS